MNPLVICLIPLHRASDAESVPMPWSRVWRSFVRSFLWSKRLVTGFGFGANFSTWCILFMPQEGCKIYTGGVSGICKLTPCHLVKSLQRIHEIPDDFICPILDLSYSGKHAAQNLCQCTNKGCGRRCRETSSCLVVCIFISPNRGTVLATVIVQCSLLVAQRKQ